MENQNLTSEQREHYLFITSHGTRSDLKSVVDFSLMINELAGQTSTPYLLLDYRNVKFNLPTTNAFDGVRIYEAKMTNLKNITMALVISEGNKEKVELWTELSQKRGFQFKTFFTIQEGENWLLEKQGH